MSVRLAAVSFEAAHPRVPAAFWADMLDRSIVDGPDGAFLPGDDTQVGLAFVAPSTASSRQRFHLHLTSASIDDQQRIVEKALRSGARRRGSRPFPFGRDIYLIDPGGNDFCVIEPGNTYIAGCGPLGEVTCDGRRRAGLFWRDVLRWPLVWDQGEQTVIQHAAGGTKVAWDPWPGFEPGPSRQRFDLIADDPGIELERLRELGATLLAERPSDLLLVDPDGAEFTLRR